MAFSYKRSITVDHTKVPSTQSNFPILVSFTDTTFRITGSGGHVTNSSGHDIGFFSDSGLTTAIPWEIERYISTTGEVIAWVKVASLSSSVDTVIYVGYGDSGITSFQSTASSVWDSNFKGIWHLADGFSLTANDSTSGASNGTLVNTPAPGVGQIGGGAYFVSASAQSINLGAPSAFNSLQCPMTISAWFNSNTTSGLQTIFSQFNTVFGGQAPKLVRIDAGAINYYCNDNAGGLQQATYTTSNPSINNWHYLAVKVGGSLASPTLNIALDGVNQTLSLGAITASPVTSIDARIGGNTGQPATEGFNGLIDEVRISNIARSADWGTVERNTMLSPSTFFALGSETFIPPVAVGRVSRSPVLDGMGGIGQTRRNPSLTGI